MRAYDFALKIFVFPVYHPRTHCAHNGGRAHVVGKERSRIEMVSTTEEWLQDD